MMSLSGRNRENAVSKTNTRSLKISSRDFKEKKLKSLVKITE